MRRRRTSPYREKSSGPGQTSGRSLSFTYLGIGRDINPQFFDQPLRHSAIRSRALDGKCSAKAQHGPLAGVELVALGVSAKVVVIVEDENARLRPGSLAEEMGGGEAADAPTDDDQVIVLACVDRRSCLIPESSVAQAMSGIKRSRMTAAQAGQSRGIVVRRFFRSVGNSGSRKQIRRKNRSADGEATPFRKSRRVIPRPIPNSRSFQSFTRVLTKTAAELCLGAGQTRVLPWLLPLA